MQFARNLWKQLFQTSPDCGEKAEEGETKEKAESSTKLTDQGVNWVDQHLFLLQYVGGDIGERELIWL